MDLRLIHDILYLSISICLTIWVGRTLHRNGRPFLVDVFRQEGLADSINHLLVVGFYLINFGVDALLINFASPFNSIEEMVRQVVTKAGIALLILGGLHFMNLRVLNQLRKSRLRHHLPISADGRYQWENGAWRLIQTGPIESAANPLPRTV